MYKKRVMTILLGLLVLFSSQAYAELDKRSSKEIYKSVKDKETADFIVKHSKRVGFRGNSLYKIDMSKQGITHLPKGFASLKSVKELRLANNNFNEFPSAILHLTNLESLSLIGNDISSVPQNISSLSSLKSLELFGNELTSLPDSICRLHKLEKLGVSNNKLTKLPECIGELSQLSTLSVYRNRLTRLPDSIVNLKNAFMISLNSNQLTTLPDNIGNLENIKHLNLEDNKLKVLPTSLYKLSKIESIGTTFGDKSRKYERKRGESPQKFFKRCYKVKWRNDADKQTLNREKPAHTEDNKKGYETANLLDKGKRADMAEEAGRALTKAIIGTLVSEDRGNETEAVEEKYTESVEQLSAESNEILKSKHIKVATSEPSSGSTISFEYSDMPGHQGDWIALTKANLADDNYGEYFYPYGKKSGTHKFSSVPAGDYEIRVYYDWPSGGYNVQDRLKLKVR